jgi:acyl carrier protein
MSKLEIAEEVRQVIADVFALGLGDVGPSTASRDIPDWDSVRHLDVVMALEQQFACSFSPEEMAEMTTVPAIAEMVRRKRG